MLPSDIRLNPAERSSPSRAALSPAEPSRYLAPFGVGLVYAIILSLLFFENRLDPVVAPETAAIPIEIVVEPPPQKKPDSPAPNPEPPPTAPPILEQPAFDAPHAANNEKIETKAPDETSKSPPAPPTTKPPSPNLDPGKAVGPTREEELQAKENSAEPVLDKPAGEARPTAELNREKSDQQQARADAEAQTEKLDTSAGYQFPIFEPAPEFDFGSLFKQTPVAGGKANSTYLSILYGTIMPHMHSPVGSRANWPRLEGMLVFSVDRRGNLTQRRIVRESGSRDLDAAALEAVAQASPFPPPPKGIPLEFTFTYVAN